MLIGFLPHEGKYYVKIREKDAVKGSFGNVCMFRGTA
jgi:hypothetical protein